TPTLDGRFGRVILFERTKYQPERANVKDGDSRMDESTTRRSRAVEPGTGESGTEETRTMESGTGDSRTDELLTEEPRTAESPSRRGALRQRLAAAGRELSDAIVLFHTVLAERLGLGASDWKTLGLLESHGAMTAGELAAHTGLAPASVTGILD